jgi:hypothetical protein
VCKSKVNQKANLTLFILLPNLLSYSAIYEPKHAEKVAGYQDNHDQSERLEQITDVQNHRDAVVIFHDICIVLSVVDYFLKATLLDAFHHLHKTFLADDIGSFEDPGNLEKTADV